MEKILSEVNARLSEAALVKHALRGCAPEIAKIADQMITVLKKGGTVYLFGNGGSAADAQHLASELVGRFQVHKRKPLPAVALTTDTSLLTSIGNDYGFKEIFSRQVTAQVAKGDLVIGISTSGNSLNVLEGIKAARKRGAYTIGFAGQSGGKLKTKTHLCLRAPSNSVARIQECHITAGHIICEIVEQRFLKS